MLVRGTYNIRPKKHLENEQSKDAAVKKRPNTSGVYIHTVLKYG